MRTCAIVVESVLGQDRAQVALVEDDQMVEALAAQRADQALGDRVRLGRVHRREDRLDADPGSARDEGAAVAAVAIADQVARLFAPRCRGDHLPPDPFGRRVAGDVEMDEPPPVMRHEEEHVERVEGDRRHREEVGRPDVRRVVAQEGTPGLRRRPPEHPPSIAADGLRADLEAQLLELATDAHATPARVLAGEALDQLLWLLG